MPFPSPLRHLMLPAVLSCLFLAGCGGGTTQPSGNLPAPGSPSTPAPAPPQTTVLKPRGTFASAAASNTYTHPQLRGVLLRASWSSVEPSPGVFDFTVLQQQVASVKDAGKPWSLAIGAGGPGSPSWLLETLGAASISYSFRGTPMRLPLFWDTTVQERLEQLARALAQKFGSDPALQLVYIPQMSANGIEGHLQGVDMA